MAPADRLARRRWLLGAASLASVAPLAMAATGLGRDLRGPRAAHAANPDPAPERPVRRVMLIGSSMIVGALGRLLADNLESRGYVTDRRAKSSSGLSRPDFFDWPREVRKAMSDFKPDATVVMFGGNDAQGIWTRSEPKWIRWPEPAWSAWYAGRVAELSELLGRGGQRIAWLGAPRMSSPSLDERMQRLNGIYAQQMAMRPNGLYVSTAEVLAGANGGYARKLPVDGKMVEVRTADGVHVTMAGGRRVADGVIDEIDAFFSRPTLITARASDAPCLPRNRR